MRGLHPINIYSRIIDILKISNHCLTFITACIDQVISYLRLEFPVLLDINIKEAELNT